MKTGLLRNRALESKRLLCTLVACLGFASLGLGMAEQERHHDPAWAASVASAHPEVMEWLEHRPSDRMVVEFAERWSVWRVTFFEGEDTLVSVSVNHDGEIVEVEQGNEPEAEATRDGRELEERRQSLLRELDFARSVKNRAEEREILELLERLERNTNANAYESRKRNVDLRPEDSPLPAYVLSLPEDGIRRMNRSVTEDIDIRGEFRLEEERFPIEIRLRGASTRHALKKSYRLRFLERSPISRKVTHLKAEPMDHTMQQEKLSCDLFKAAGLPVSECRYVNLFINGSYEGVYLDMEPIRSPFKHNHGLDPKGTLIRAGTFQHKHRRGPIGELRGEVGSLDELREFIHRLNRVGNDEFESFVLSETDWPRVRDYLAMQVICHRSEIEADDYLFYRDPDTGKWSFIPRDHNNGNFAVVPNRNRIAAPSISIYPQTIQDIGWRPEYWFVLPSRIFNNATLRNDYLDRLEKFVNHYLLTDVVADMIDTNYQSLLAAYPMDPYRTPWQSERDPFLDSAADLKQFARRHGRRLLDLIEQERMRPEPELGIDGASRHGDQYWVRLHNRSPNVIRLNRCLLATKDSQGRNHSMALTGQIQSGEYQVVQLGRHRGEDQNSSNFDAGLLVLARSSDRNDEDGQGQEEILDFLFLNRAETSEESGR